MEPAPPVARNVEGTVLSSIPKHGEGPCQQEPGRFSTMPISDSGSQNSSSLTSSTISPSSFVGESSLDLVSPVPETDLRSTTGQEENYIIEELPDGGPPDELLLQAVRRQYGHGVPLAHPGIGRGAADLPEA